MRIIAVNRYYRPDHSATSQLLSDLAECLAIHGDEVIILTSRLIYDSSDLLPRREMLGGVSVRRLWSTRFGRRSLMGRTFDYATFYLSAFAALLRTARRGDTVIALSDPPLISVAAALAGLVKRFELVNWCQDLFPEVAGALGIKWADGGVGQLLKAVRNWSLRSARFNGSIHSRMSERLKEMGVPASKIRVLPNWADAGIRPIPCKDNPLRREWGLSDRYVIGYSGNLGRGHLPKLVARLVADTKDIEGLSWLFIGGGTGLECVRDAGGGAPNILFKPYQPRERLGESLSVPDIHLISLDPNCEGYMVPSKLYGARAAGRPVLYLGATDGAIASDVEAYGAGIVLDPSRPEAWRALVESLVVRRLSRNPACIPLAWCAGWSAFAALSEWRRQLLTARAEAGGSQAPEPAGVVTVGK